MKKMLATLSLGSALMLMTTGCALNPLIGGGILTSVTGPVAATSLESASKEGTATCKNILGLFAFGDCSIEAASKAGSITKIKHVDTKVFSVLGIYTEATTIVKGN